MSRDHNYHVYILECSDGLYYTGVTNDIERRLKEHEDGNNPTCFTFNRRPVKIRYCENFNDINRAIAREKQLKGWSRKKKEALMNQDIEELKRLSKSSLQQARGSE